MFLKFYNQLSCWIHDLTDSPGPQRGYCKLCDYDNNPESARILGGGILNFPLSPGSRFNLEVSGGTSDNVLSPPMCFSSLTARLRQLLDIAPSPVFVSRCLMRFFVSAAEKWRKLFPVMCFVSFFS